MRLATVAAVAVLALVASTASAGIVFGSYTYDKWDAKGIWANMNYWLSAANYGNGLPQAVRILEIGWGPVDTDVKSAIDSIRGTWGWASAVPLVTWMPYGYKKWTSPTPNDDICNGMYDDYIDAFLGNLSVGFVHQQPPPARRMYLRFAPAPNGNWFPWSPQCPGCSSSGQHIQQSAASYIRMWNYVMAKVRAPKYNLTKDVLMVMFDVGTYSASGPISDFYPEGNGNPTTIDWFGIDGMNWGNTLPGNSWTDPSALFGPSITALRALNASKPVGIASAASTSHPNGETAKTSWIRALIDLCVTKGIKMLTYHNADSSTDMALFGGSAGPQNYSSPVSNGSFLCYNVWRDQIANGSNAFIGQDSANPRYMNDSAFQGH